jgi:hypothetical protein
VGVLVPLLDGGIVHVGVLVGLAAVGVRVAVFDVLVAVGGVLVGVCGVAVGVLVGVHVHENSVRPRWIADIVSVARP